MRYEPMKAHLGGLEILRQAGYVFEPKLDGVRAVCIYRDGQLQYFTRNGHDVTFKYPDLDIKDSIDASSCVLDGEIVAYNAHGNPDFHLLARRDRLQNPETIIQRSREIPATFAVFDIIEKDGEDLVSVPLEKRKEILEKTLKNGGKESNLQLVMHTPDGQRLWDEMVARDLEGVMAKMQGSPYLVGRRSESWLKIKNIKTADCVIIGFTAQQRRLSSLAVGLYTDGRLRYMGKVGTGFDETEIEYLREKLDKIRSTEGPPDLPADVKPVSPILVCEIKYMEVTVDSRFRAPVFMRLRDDKDPEECTFEQLP